MTADVIWSPNSKPQRRYLASTAYEAMYGGAAGGGKSEALLLGALRCVHDASYAAILFRRSFPELQKSLIERSHLYYPRAFPEAKYNTQEKVWRFPSGARIYFGHLQNDLAVHDHQSAEYQYIGFDELTSFTRYQYTYMMSRGRSSTGLPVRIRSATNPGGIGHEWVFERWRPWLDVEAKDRAQPGEVRYVIPAADGGEKYVERGTLAEPDKSGHRAIAAGRVFFPALATDNPALMSSDPGYIGRLAAMDIVNAARLRDGDWMIAPAPGLYYKRKWIEIVDHVPDNIVNRARVWDLAATDEKTAHDPDWTIGMKGAITDDNVLYIEDVDRMREDPGSVEDAIVRNAKMDGRECTVGIPQDPGQAGKSQVSHLTGKLFGYNVEVTRPTGDKVVRASPASALARAGHIKMVRAPWNAAVLAILEAFPTKGVHDDDVDALSDLVTVLGVPPPARGAVDESLMPSLIA